MSYWRPSSRRSRCGNSNVAVPSSRRTIFTPATKSFRSGTWASTLLPTTRLARRPSATSRSRRLASEELDERRHAALLGRRRDVRGRIDPEHRDSRPDEVLEQVAVVRRELDDEVVRAEPEALADHLDVRARVLDPRRRVAGEVRVLREDLLRRDERGQLHEPAARTGADVQGVERLHLVEPVGRKEALAERRHPEVDDRQLERCAAEAAADTVARRSNALRTHSHSLMRRPLRVILFPGCRAPQLIG